MTLSVEGLIEAILSAHDIEKLQAEVREALITQLIASPPNDRIISGAPTV